MKDRRSVQYKLEADTIPALTEELVSHLEYLYPPRCMSVTENGNAHQRYAGKVELVATLRDHLTAQTEEHLVSIGMGEEDE